MKVFVIVAVLSVDGHNHAPDEAAVRRGLCVQACFSYHTLSQQRVLCKTLKGSKRWYTFGTLLGCHIEPYVTVQY